MSSLPESAAVQRAKALKAPLNSLFFVKRLGSYYEQTENIRFVLLVDKGSGNS